MTPGIRARAWTLEPLPRPPKICPFLAHVRADALLACVQGAVAETAMDARPDPSTAVGPSGGVLAGPAYAVEVQQIEHLWGLLSRQQLGRGRGA